MKTFKLLYISITSFGLMGFNIAESAVFNHSKLWDKSILSVCFATMDFGPGSKRAAKSLRVYGETQVEFSDHHIKLITETLKTEFTMELTHTEVTGFEDCKKGVKSDVVIIASAKFQAG